MLLIVAQFLLLLVCSCCASSVSASSELSQCSSLADVNGCAIGVCSCHALFEECDARGGTCDSDHFFCTGACVSSWKGIALLSTGIACVGLLVAVVVLGRALAVARNKASKHQYSALVTHS